MIIKNGCKKSSLEGKLSFVRYVRRFFIIDRMVLWFQLVKMPVCLFVAFSAILGAVLAGEGDGAAILLISLGMLSLACGGAAMNSLQEIGLDASMVRTRERPLPKGRISVDQALFFAVFLILVGLFLLYQASHLIMSVMLGLAAVLLYNLVYTNLKTRSVAAIIPGAVSGALPPYIGWTAAGGDPFGIPGLLLGALFIFWQVPHSLLILLQHRDDYLNSDIPSLVKLFSVVTLKRLFLIWLASFCIVLVLFSIMFAGLALGVKIGIWISAFLLFLIFYFQLSCQTRNDYYFLFIQLNAYLFFIMALLICQKVYLG